MDENHLQATKELLLVDVNQTVVAIAIDSIQEVIEYTRVTRVPMCSSDVCGVINVRGSVVPVIDAASRLGLTTQSRYDKYSCIVLYESVHRPTGELLTLGLVVKRVRSIETVDALTVYNKPAFGTHIPTQFIEAMVQINQETMPILLMSQLLDAEQLNALMLQNQGAMLARWES